MPSDEMARFEAVDWDAIEGTGRRVTPERALLVTGVTLVALLWLYDYLFVHVWIYSDWRLDRIDYAFLLSVVVLVSYVGYPLYRRRTRVRELLSGLWGRPVALVGLGWLSLIVFLGVFGPGFVSLEMRLRHTYHPPYGFSSQVLPYECLGGTSGPPLDRVCYGTLRYPLGTNHAGYPMEHLVVAGARVAVYVAVITTVVVFPIATLVGVIAGIRGGIIDGILMSYVDVQLSIPAIVVYFIGYIYWSPSLLLLIATFGLLSWGGIARLVRSEVIKRRHAGFIRVARSLGASDRYLARRHVLPNITNTLIPAAAHLLALYILFEAGVAFLGFYHFDLTSWGTTISQGTDSMASGQLLSGYPEDAAYQVWWVATVPALALALTMFSLKVLGDAFRDALDPRRGT